MGTWPGRATTSFCPPRTKCPVASMCRWRIWGCNAQPGRPALDVEPPAHLAPALIELLATRCRGDGRCRLWQMPANVRDRHEPGGRDGESIAQVPAPLCVALQEA